MTKKSFRKTVWEPGNDEVLANDDGTAKIMRADEYLSHLQSIVDAQTAKGHTVYVELYDGFAYEFYIEIPETDEQYQARMEKEELWQKHHKEEVANSIRNLAERCGFKNVLEALNKDSSSSPSGAVSEWLGSQSARP